MKTIESTGLYREKYAEILNSYGGREFYRIENDIFFDGERVHSDFPVLMSVPFTHHTTIRFNEPWYFSENAEESRKELLESIYKTLNNRIERVFFGLKTGNDTARYIYSNEYGASDDEIHLHLLTHLHTGVSDLVSCEVSKFFSELEKSEIMGIGSIKTSEIYDAAGIVSYICKIEKDSMGALRMDKKLRFSKGFQRVIKQKFYKPDDFPEPFRMLVCP